MAKPRKTATASIIVYVRDLFGSPLEVQPVLSLASFPRGRRIHLRPKHVADAWVFAGVRSGKEVFVDVDAVGYQPARKAVEIPRRKPASAYVIFFLQASDERMDFHPPQLSFILPPLAQKEVQPAIRDLARRKTKSACGHLKKALKQAPENPLVNELAGQCFLRENRPGSAEAYLQRAVSIDPSDFQAWLGLGVARYRRGDSAGAIRILEQARRLDRSSWRLQWVLAASYLRERKFHQAWQAIEQAQVLAKRVGQKWGEAGLLQAEALEGLGERSLASQAFEDFVEKNRHSPQSARLLRDSKGKRDLATKNGRDRFLSGQLPLSPPALPLPKLRPGFWIPPDVDAERPFLIAGAACPLREILKGAAARAVQYVKDIQQFTATEDFQSLSIGRNGELGRPFQHKFSYLVFLDQPRSHLIRSRVMRDRSFGLTGKEIGGPLMDSGSPVLALVFHPAYAKDLDWKCEGLGEWHGQPAWVIHFRQRSDRPVARLHGFNTRTKEYLLPLKGLIWVTTKGDQVVRLETDLVNPLPAVRLGREHFVIEYREVAFHSHPVRLMLPETVDAFLEYRGKFYHHYHHFSHFELFWAGPKSAGKKKSGKRRHR